MDELRKKIKKVVYELLDLDKGTPEYIEKEEEFSRLLEQKAKLVGKEQHRD